MATRLLVAGYFYNTAKSDDGGLTWQYGSLPLVNGLPLINGGPNWALAASPTRYLAVPVFWDYWETGLPNDPNQVAYSTNGTTWTQASIGTVTYKLSNPSWTGTKFVVVDSDSAFSSTDGSSWSKAAVGFSVSFASNELTPVTAVVGTRVIAVWPNYSSSKIAYSDNHGATWTDATPGGLSLYVSYLRVVDGVVYLASGRKLLQSTDSGATWTELQADMGISTPATDFGPLAKIGSAFFTPGMGYGGGTNNPSANHGRRSTTPATAPWDTVNHNLDAQYIYTGSQTSTTAYFVGGHQTPDGNGFSQPLLVSSTDGLTYTPVSFNSAAVVNPGDGWLYLTDVLAIEYTPTPTFDGSIEDEMTFSDALGTNAQQVFASIAESLGISLEFAHTLRMSASITDMMIMFSDGSVAWPVSASIDSTLVMADGGARADLVDTDPALNPTQFCVNTAGNAVSVYTDHGFDQFASVGQDLYGVREDGVYLINSGTAQAVDAMIDFGATTFGTQRSKSVQSVFLGMESDGEVYVHVTSAGKERSYRVAKRGHFMKALCAKGAMGHAIGVKVLIGEASHADLDVVEFFTVISNRRWTR